MPRIKEYEPMEVFLYLCRFKEQNDGVTPTLRAIADGLGIGSTSTVHRILENLVKLRMITPVIINGKNAGYKVLGASWHAPNQYRSLL